MPKSTPGPWRARNCQTAVLVDTICNGDAMLIALVADNDSQGDTDTERKMNNARLIAAAPQMLEALETCRGIFAEYVKIHKAKIPEFQPAIFPSPFAEVEEKIRRNQEMVDICDAAIAAAKGE